MGVWADPVSLIVAALAPGCALGLKDRESAAVKDACEVVKTLAGKRLAGHRDGTLVLVRRAKTPRMRGGPFAAELTAANAGDGAALVAAAQVLMRLVDHAGCRSGKYNVDAGGSQGMQIGDHNSQHNVLGRRSAAGARGTDR